MNLIPLKLVALLLALFPTISVFAVDLGESPKQVMEKFLKLTKESAFEQADRLFDLSPRLIQRINPAQKLSTLLDYHGDLKIHKISSHVLGNMEDHEDPDSEIVGFIKIGPIIEPIILTKVTENDYISWRFSKDFALKLPKLYALIPKYSTERFFAQWTPEWLKEVKIFGMKIWQWISMVFSLIFLYFASSIVLIPVFKLLLSFVKRVFGYVPEGLKQDLYKPSRIIFMASSFYGLSYWLELSLMTRNMLFFLLSIVLLLCMTSISLNIIDHIVEYFHFKSDRKNRKNLFVVIGPLQKMFKVICIIIAVSFFLTSIGVNVTAIIAGLGVGGIAVALASQKSIENLFGGISVIIDRPVQVGDFCKFGEQMLGTVEEIGLRSTRVRTLKRTLVCIPNAEFSQLKLENYQERDKMHFHHILTLRYDAKAEQIKMLLIELREMLLVHDKVDSDGSRVRFINLSNTGVEIEINSYVKTQRYDEFLAIKEDLNLKILSILENCGLSLAFPTQTVVLEKQNKIDESSSHKAARILEEKKNTLGEHYIHYYPKEHKDKISDSYKFPIFPEVED